MSKILCIDDEPDLLEDLIEVLDAAGFETMQAGDGREGLELILQHPPDLVICDITMPHMTGFELLTELRQKHPQFGTMPFIFLSALANQTDMISGLNLGANDYLTKPVNYELLVAKIGSELSTAERIKAHMEEVQVRLYTALSAEQKAAKQSPKQPAKNPEKRPVLPPLKITLVGNDPLELWGVQRAMENEGHTVTVFTSGRAYLSKHSAFPAHVTILWQHNDDIPAPMIASSRPKGGGPCALLTTGGSAYENKVVPGIDFTLNMPISLAVLAEKIANWEKSDTNGNQEEALPDQ